MPRGADWLVRAVARRRRSTIEWNVTGKRGGAIRNVCRQPLLRVTLGVSKHSMRSAQVQPIPAKLQHV